MIVIAAEHSFGITASLSLDGMEYNGTPLIEAVEENTTPGAAAVYFLDDPGPGRRDPALHRDEERRLRDDLHPVGHAAGVEATGQSLTDSVDLTTLTADSLVVAGLLDGGQATNGNGAAAPLVNLPMTQVQSDIWGGNTWGGFACGYQVAAAPGPVTSSFTALGPIRLRTVAASFGVAEPPQGTNYCGPAVVNTSGAPATIAALGSNVVADNDLTLVASSLPPNQFGLFINSLGQGFVPNPGGSQGNLCLSGAIGRYNPAAGFPVQSSGAGGAIALQIDLGQTPTPAGFFAISAGQTWNFQMWYREPEPRARLELHRRRQRDVPLSLAGPFPRAFSATRPLPVRPLP